MHQRLNTSQISQSMRSLSFTQEYVAERLGVVPELIRQWLDGEVTPVAHRLVRLSMLLDLSFEDMFVSDVPKMAEPIVAYRKMAGKVTTDIEIGRAKEKGRLLQPLSQFTSHRNFRPAALRSPTCDYDYLQQVVGDLRKNFRVEADAVIGPGNFIEKFNELGAVIVPVMWGKREAHGNALHILLPDSGNTWIFLNLDANTCDFNFWMAHELAHVLTPDLAGSEAGEDFADAFAQALLFPKACAEKLFNELQSKRANTGYVVNAFKRIAADHFISPYTVYKAINSYADRYGHKDFKHINMYGAAKNFEKQFQDISTLLFQGESPTAEKYVSEARETFQTPVFELIKSYLADTPQGPGWLAEVLEIPFLDAKSLFEYLTGTSQ